jgi:hypothetical protein
MWLSPAAARYVTFFVSGFRPAGENQKQEDDSYRSAEG